MSNKKIIIFKNDAVGDLVHSLPAINNIISKTKNNNITLFLSERSRKFSFLIDKENIDIRFLNYDLTIIDKLKIFFYVFNSQIDEVYILTPKNFYFYLPFFFRKIDFYAICINNINNYRRPGTFLRKYLYKYVINSRDKILRKSTKDLQIELSGSNNVSSSIVNFNKFLTSKDSIFKNKYIYLHFTKKKFHELGWKFKELLSLLNELKKYKDYIYITKDNFKDEYDDIFKKNFNYYSFKSKKLIDNKKKIFFLDDVEGKDLFNVIGFSDKVVGCHGMSTNLASLLNKQVLDLFYIKMNNYESYLKARTSFHEFKPKYNGYDFILPKPFMNKNFKKMKFSLVKCTNLNIRV